MYQKGEGCERHGNQALDLCSSNRTNCGFPAFIATCVQPPQPSHHCLQSNVSSDVELHSPPHAGLDGLDGAVRRTTLC